MSIERTIGIPAIDFFLLIRYNTGVTGNIKNTLGKKIRWQRITMSLTLLELAAKSDVSTSHLGRIERGERFPSARVLRKIARPLGFREDELFTLADFLSPAPTDNAEENSVYIASQLDPYVARVLGQEPVKVQQAVIKIFTLFKDIAKSMSKDSD